MYYESGNYLAHHGIKGQKWGVRRFQNPDGTRTVVGKKREKANREIDHEKLAKSTDAKTLYKNRSQLSDKELQDRLNRLRNEQALEQMAHARTNEGKKAVKQIIADSGKEAMKESVKKVLINPAVDAVVGAGAAWVAKNGAKILVTVVLSAVLRGPIKD